MGVDHGGPADNGATKARIGRGEATATLNRLIAEMRLAQVGWSRLASHVGDLLCCIVVIRGDLDVDLCRFVR
jgi:hypothetical protein